MGSEEDPKDGSAVAGAVFGAVFIYIVRQIRQDGIWTLLTHSFTGVLCLLRIPSLPPLARKPPRRDKSVMSTLTSETFCTIIRVGGRALFTMSRCGCVYVCTANARSSRVEVRKCSPHYISAQGVLRSYLEVYSFDRNVYCIAWVIYMYMGLYPSVYFYPQSRTHQSLSHSGSNVLLIYGPSSQYPNFP
jgi:hypothetical protein